MDNRSCALSRARDLERHGTERVAIRGHPPGIRNEEFAIRIERHHRAVEDAAEPAKQLVTMFSDRPLERVTAEWARNAHGPRDVPPADQCSVIEKGGQDRVARCSDGDATGELTPQSRVTHSWELCTGPG